VDDTVNIDCVFTVDSTVTPWESFICCVFGHELHLGALPSLPKLFGLAAKLDLKYLQKVSIVLSDPKYFKKGLSLVDQVEAGNGHQTQVAWEWQGIKPKSIRSYSLAWPKTFGSGVLAQL